MKAVILKSFGDADELLMREIPEPSIQPDEVLIRIKSVSINPIDVKTRKGKGQAARLQQQDPMILGWDVSGTVVKAGGNVGVFKEGDDVFGMINIPGIGKAYAEFVAAPEAHLARKPSNISFQEAAAASLAALTAWQALVTHGKVSAGQRVLIHGASGGVGHFAVQIAKHFGAHVTGVSSAEHREFVQGLGADDHIDYKNQRFEDEVKPVDFILDHLGGEHLNRSLQVLKPGGTLISLPSGVSENVAELAATQGKTGIFFMVQSSTADMRHIAGLLEQRVIQSHVFADYAFEDIRKAHDQVESGKTRGKVTVSWRQ